MSQPTDHFADLVFDGGTPSADCQFCGRCHYDATGEFMDPGELKALEAKRAAEPARYVAHEGTIHTGLLDGRQAVAGCQCGKVAEIERMIWMHRRLISNYLIRRTRFNFQQAQTEAEQMQQLGGLAPSKS